MVIAVCTRLVSHSILEHMVHSCALLCTLCTLCTYGHNIVKSAQKCMIYFDVHFCALCVLCALCALKDTELIKVHRSACSVHFVHFVHFVH